MVQSDNACPCRVLHQRISHRTLPHTPTRSTRRDPSRHDMWHSLKLRYFGCCLAGLVSLGATLLASPGVARADEFTTIAPGDPLYGDLIAVTRAGWLDAAPSGSRHSLT